MAAAPVALDLCVCLLFLDEWSSGRIEYYPDCPRHWRIFEDEYAIPRESRLVKLHVQRDGRWTLHPAA